MTLCTASGSLPTHQYCYVQPNAIGAHEWLRVAWFGITSYPGRTWGCHVLLECGAVYRNVPIHQLASEPTDVEWSPSQGQTWDCYGREFSVVEYAFLSGRLCVARLRDGEQYPGKYLFTIVPIGDQWSAHPDQDKEFTVIALANGRYTAQPTDRTLFEDRSFTTKLEWPSWLRRQQQTWSAEL